MISIIVPIYNVEEYLNRCLDSIVAQDYSDYEVLLIDDGSKDSSEDICLSYLEKYNNFYYYYKENGGLSDARNYGLNFAKGEYICFVDSDDYLREDYLSKLIDKAIQEKSDIVICDYYDKYDNHEVIRKGKVNKNNNIIKDYLLSPPNAWNKLYKKTLFTKNNIRYPKGLFYEDLATTPILLTKARKISYIDEALYYYVQRQGSIMNQTSYNKKNDDIFDVINIINEHYKKENIYEKYKEEFEYICITRLLHDYVLRIYRYPEGEEGINKAISYMKNNYPNYSKNKYYLKENLKYKMVCNLIYNKNINILKLLLK